jgi:EmrB/QacA subfamily drug resistance transporter
MTTVDPAVKKSALLVATLSSFLTPLMGSSINVALPAIAEEFEMTAVTLSWVATSFLLAAAMFLVPFGRLADIRGRKKVFAVGIAVYTLASLLSAYATSGEMLIALRVLQGIGAAMIFGIGVAILTSVYPPGERGRALGITVAAVYTGLSVGPFFGGFMTEHFGWRSIFLVQVPIGVAIILVIFWKLKGEWLGARGEKYDLVGAIIYAITLLAGTYGISILPDFDGIWITLIGVAGLVLFIIREKRMPSPVFHVELFSRNRLFAMSNLAALIHYSATYAITFLMSLYLQYIKSLTPEQAGLVLVSQPIMMAIFSPFAGRLSDRIEPRIVASIGMSLTATGILMLAFVAGNTSLVYIIAGLVVLGFGYALFSSPNTNAIMSSVERQHYGIASGSAGTMRTVGQVISMSITMLIFALLLGSVEIMPESYPAFLKSTRLILAIFVVLTGFGIMASMARGEARGKNHSNT